MTVRVRSIDHVVLTVADVDATVAFYSNLGLTVERGRGRLALRAGDQRIVLQELGRNNQPTAARPTTGASSFCFVVNGPIERVERRLATRGISTVAGPVERPGAQGWLRSVYVRDPDGNLVELGSYAPAEDRPWAPAEHRPAEAVPERRPADAAAESIPEGRPVDAGPERRPADPVPERRRDGPPEGGRPETPRLNRPPG